MAVKMKDLKPFMKVVTTVLKSGFKAYSLASKKAPATTKAFGKKMNNTILVIPDLSDFVKRDIK